MNNLYLHNNPSLSDIKIVSDLIDNNIDEIKQLIEKYKYKDIYYSVGKNNKLGTSIFKVGEDVIDYIDEQICKLSILDVIIYKIS